MLSSLLCVAVSTVVLASLLGALLVRTPPESGALHRVKATIALAACALVRAAAWGRGNPSESGAPRGSKGRGEKRRRQEERERWNVEEDGERWDEEDEEEEMQSTGDATARDEEHEESLDFHGWAPEGQTLLVARIGQAAGTERQVWLYLRTPEHGHLQHIAYAGTAVRAEGGHAGGWRAGGLRMACLEPQRRWKISFNGIMRKGSVQGEHCKDEESEELNEELEEDEVDEVGEEEEGVVHVRFTFTWTAFTLPFDFPAESPSAAAVADAAAREPWGRRAPSSLLLVLRRWWAAGQSVHREQWGQMLGSLEVHGRGGGSQLLLRAVRTRSRGPRDSIDHYISFLAHFEDGTCIHVTALCIPDITSCLSVGYVMRPNGIKHGLEWSDICLADVEKHGELRDTYRLTLRAGGRTHRLLAQPAREARGASRSRLQPGAEQPGTEIDHDDCASSRYLLDNDVRGWGTVRLSRRRQEGHGASGGGGGARRPPAVVLERRPVELGPAAESGKPLVPLENLVPGESLVPGEPLENLESLVLSLHDARCRVARAVGGKAAQLATLSAAGQGSAPVPYTVPRGVCVTVAAFDLHVSAEPTLALSVRQLSDLACGRVTGDLQDSCSRIPQRNPGRPLQNEQCRSLRLTGSMSHLLVKRRLHARHNKGSINRGGRWVRTTNPCKGPHREPPTRNARPAAPCPARCTQLFSAAPVAGAVAGALREALSRNGLLEAGARLAVRSSAAGEDTEEMSAAGQLSTLLGVSGWEQVCVAVRACWASLYAFPAVEYRRQRGQPIASHMGVVVQLMVPAQAAGVLFTCDPVSGHPGRMVINANYGLGESVVGGSAEPDTITLARHPTGPPRVLRQRIGSKREQLVPTGEHHLHPPLGVLLWRERERQRLSLLALRLHQPCTRRRSSSSSGRGVEVREVAPGDSKRCCLSRDVIVQLGSLGLQVEEMFGSPRDIEWALVGQQLYLLQARPVTTLDIETEAEVLHEFDTAIASDREVLTTANIGEMMPGAVTPLTLSVFIRAIEFSLQEFVVAAGLWPRLIPCAHKLMGTTCAHNFINLTNLGVSTEHHNICMQKASMDLSLLGRVSDEVTMDDLLRYHGRSPLWKRIVNGVRLLRFLYGAQARVHRWQRRLATFGVRTEGSARDMYAAITRALPHYFESWSTTITASSCSGSWSIILMSILAQGKPSWTSEHFSDVAMLFSSCPDVVSADMPTAIEAMSAAIRQQGQEQEFGALDVKDAAEWLRTEPSGDAGAKFRAFLEKHGHRCLREAEFREKSWASDPSTIVAALQAALLCPQGLQGPQGPQRPQGLQATHKGDVGVHEAVARLRSPVSAVGRRILSWVLPRARRAVADREQGKSIAIKVNDEFKSAYWQLARAMRLEGFLPDDDLLFFLTHAEIATVLNERPPNLVVKAQRRRRALALQMSLNFPEISVAKPRPVASWEGTERAGGQSLTGLPISQGTVSGPARVVRSLSGASSIQRGDILIVTSTDIGWSPYFPLLGGLVTELGGLLSHGAVVAREYGLPCIVSCKGATHFFTSGETLLLNGTQGFVQRVDEK
ncbi:uncharacterized protein LOC133357820 [Lethenteron reissneri]|uniref:uncharacterized protein LOC133357820 n=1 Tax=Lethenteron reissneri TaxID=7753 RepID=UPI002AB63930|nr:uncharacterized protein LOC133357820 [Lethenteron reissneri]